MFVRHLLFFARLICDVSYNLALERVIVVLFFWRFKEERSCAQDHVGLCNPSVADAFSFLVVRIIIDIKDSLR